MSVLDQILAEMPRRAVAAGVIALFVTAIAYAHSPRVKVFIFSLPIPFTCSYLASRIAIDGSHFFALALGVTYHGMVYLLRTRMKLPIFACIGISVAIYLFLGSNFTFMRDVYPPYIAIGLLAGWIAWLRYYRPTVEPGHRSMAPWWLKLPGTFLISFTIMNLVGLMAGAAVVFPFAGVFTSYEMRHSLRTLLGQYIINLLAMGLMLLLLWAVQHHMSKIPALAIGGAIAVSAMAAFYFTGLGKPREVSPAINVESQG